MNIGLAQHAVGRYGDAIDSIRDGTAELPRSAERGMAEYKAVLNDTAEQAG